MKVVAAVIVTGGLLALGTATLGAHPLSLEQRQRFERYLPRAFPKLEARDPVHVVALGDSVTGGHAPLEGAWEDGNPLHTFVGGFLSQVAREFFYPGGVHLLNPPEGGTAKLTDYLGDEITLENLAVSDGTMLSGLRRTTTDAFLHDPDLLLIQFGVYDAFERLSIDAYRRALQEMIDIGERRKVDMIVFAPGLVNYGDGVMDWGITRPYAMAAREVAERNGVLFIDTGQHLARFGGGVNPDTHPKAAMEIVDGRLERMFHFGHELERRERVHPSKRANEYLAQAVFHEFENGPQRSHFSWAGRARFDGNGKVEVTIVLRNQTDERREGTLGALAVGNRLIPIDEAAQRFEVAAEGTTQLSFRYRRPTVGQGRDGSDILFPLEPSDEFRRFSFVMEDTVRSELIDLPLRVSPVTPVWKSRQFLNVSDKIRIEWDLVNGADRPVSGTFQVGLGERVGEPTPFSVSPLGAKTVFAVFDFEPVPGQAQFQRDVWIQVEVDGQVTRFNRELEATRDLVLGEEMPMRSWSSYADAPPAAEAAARPRPEGSARVRFDADEKALYVVASLEGVQLPDRGDEASLRARVYLDARPVGEALSFGVVKPFEVYTRREDGRGFTPDLPLGCFGNGYDMLLSGQGVASALRTGGDGARVLEIRVPRSYLHRREWNLGSMESILGVRLDLTVARSESDAGNPFPSENRYVTHSPTFAFEGETIHGFHEQDARSLSTLRLTRQPVDSWSVRIY